MGSKAPDFTLQDQDGKPVHFADHLGKQVIVLYFYPKDFTGGCTAEACAFRDSYEVFTDAGAEVIGVSADTPETHHDFAAQYRLPFTLLSDPGSKVASLYGLSKTLGIIPSRTTFVIDRDGVIRHIFKSMTNMDAHIEEARKIVLELEQETVNER
ncbi:MAG: redoxin domain-containing protein [Chloroflexi bacterium]|nr:redoxin domain-containing protein [Chloroflexota bacterium]